MRIRRNAARLLGSACSIPAASPPDAAAQSELLAPPPPPFNMVPCSAPESRVVSDFTSPASAPEYVCRFNRSPWDLISELSISDPQVEDELVDKYFVSVPYRASWLTASIPVSSAKEMKQQDVVDGDSTTKPRQQVQKKVPKKKLPVSKDKASEPKKTAKVEKQDGDQEVKQSSYKCKKNDGKQWQCHRPVSRPNSLCDYHFYQKRAHISPEFAALVAAEAAEAEMGAEAQKEVLQPALIASKPATSSKPRKKKPRHDFGATEGFYYYAGFGPCRSTRSGRSSSNMNGYVSPKKKEEELAEDGPPTEEKAQAAVGDTIQHATGCDGKSSGDAGIAGADEGSNDDHYELGRCDSSENKCSNFGGKMNKGWANGRRKPVKERSLKSLM